MDFLEFYKKNLDLNDAQFTLIDHAEGMVAKVYKVLDRSQRQFILKIHSRNHDYFREKYFLSKLRKLAVPKIINTVDPCDNFGAILMQYYPGELLRKEMLTEKIAFDLGKELAQIHSISEIGFGDPVVNFEQDPRKHFLFKFEEGLNECKDYLPLNLLKTCDDYLKENINLLLALKGPCIAHRDFRPGNIIVHNGNLCGIIDWTSARASFAEEDLCNLESDDWLGSFKDRFFEGYKLFRPLPNLNKVLPLFNIHKAIGILGFLIKTCSQNNYAELFKKNLNLIESYFK